MHSKVVRSVLDKRAAANAGTTASKLIVTSNHDKFLSVNVVETKDHNEARDLLRTGKVDVWLTDGVLLAGYRARSYKPDTFAISGRFLSIEPYGMLLRHEDTQLVALMNLEITRMMRNGDFKKLYQTWSERPISVPGRVVTLKLPMSECYVPSFNRLPRSSLALFSLSGQTAAQQFQRICRVHRR